MLLVKCLCESFGDHILQHYITRRHISAFVSCFNNSDCLYGSTTVFERSPSPACALWCYVSIISDRADEKTEKENQKGDKKQFLNRTQIEEEEFPTFKILFTKKPSLPKNSYSLTINLA